VNAAITGPCADGLSPSRRAQGCSLRQASGLRPPHGSHPTRSPEPLPRGLRWRRPIETGILGSIRSASPKLSTAGVSAEVGPPDTRRGVPLPPIRDAFKRRCSFTSSRKGLADPGRADAVSVSLGANTWRQKKRYFHRNSATTGSVKRPPDCFDGLSTGTFPTELQPVPYRAARRALEPVLAPDQGLRLDSVTSRGCRSALIRAGGRTS
jgi:hypothetical protein